MGIENKATLPQIAQFNTVAAPQDDFARFAALEAHIGDGLEKLSNRGNKRTLG